MNLDMIHEVALRGKESKSMECARDAPPSAPKRQRSLDELERNRINMFSGDLEERTEKDHILDDNDSVSGAVNHLGLPPTQNAKQTKEMSHPPSHSSRSQCHMKLCRFDELFSPPKQKIEDLQQRAETSRRSRNRSVCKLQGPRLERSSCSCPDDIGRNRITKKSLTENNRKNQSFSNLLPTINEFQRISFDEDCNGRFQADLVHCESPRSLELWNKRTRRFASPPEDGAESESLPFPEIDDSIFLD